MSIQIITRHNGIKADIQTIDRVPGDAPQISYNSEGRISIRVPQFNGDVLVVLDRPLSRELIRFIKNGISENPMDPAWCKECATELNNDIPF
jgi:hypothetical protein